ncbi:hypothetical protein M758_2G102900 [Ceratodon purpureus]|nr:hypothetical protein M758_2G102900 [Ceratodon purpureus]
MRGLLFSFASIYVAVGPCIHRPCWSRPYSETDRSETKNPTCHSKCMHPAYRPETRPSNNIVEYPFSLRR